MGRLPAVVALLVVAGCKSDPVKPGSGGRSDQVVASGTSATSSTSASTSTSHAAAAPRGPVCDTSVSGRAMPRVNADFVDEAGEVSTRSLPAAGGRARWLSFFASWCGPCKEEMPRVKSFAARLGHDGLPVDVTYVSIDDDLRQLEAFFAQQPEGGLKSSYWLKDGPVRTAWLASLKMKSDPPLPEHALFDAKGHLRCFVSGAIEDGDYAQIAAALK